MKLQPRIKQLILVYLEKQFINARKFSRMEVLKLLKLMKFVEESLKQTISFQIF